MGIMGTFSYLATSEGGFGFNFDILETNLINLAILVGVLIYYGSKVISNILSERHARIEEEVTDAENRVAEAANALKKAQQSLTEAQARADKIRAEAQVSAQKASEEILAQGAKEVEKIKAAAVQELDSEQAKVIAELKQRIAVLAIERVESQLKERLDDSAQTRLIERSIAQLGGESWKQAH